jgi:hypothetical protein
MAELLLVFDAAAAAKVMEERAIRERNGCILMKWVWNY